MQVKSSQFYGGWCQECKTYHHLPDTLAKPYALELIDHFKVDGCLDYESDLVDREIDFETAGLFDDYGKMFGVLVCKNQDQEIIVLKAFSYGYGKRWNCANWVPPIFNEKAYDELGLYGNTLIHPLSDQIALLTLNTPQCIDLMNKRKKVSQALMEEYLDLYQIQTAKYGIQNIRRLFYLKKQIPMSTGDCCAPKLISHALKLGLQPLSLSEFYYGNSGKDGKRLSEVFYSSCPSKCIPILGTMICGLSKAQNINSKELQAFYPEETS